MIAPGFSDMEQTSGFAAFREKVQAPALTALADDWDRFRRNRRMPTWGDFKPAPDAPYLDSMWAFDYDRAAGGFIGRFAGKGIMLGFGRSFLGTPLSALHAPHVLELARASFLKTVSEPACIRWSGKLFRMDEQTVEGERLILPIGADPQAPDGVLGASWYEGYPVSHTPKHVELLHDIADWCRV